MDSVPEVIDSPSSFFLIVFIPYIRGCLYTFCLYIRIMCRICWAASLISDSGLGYQRICLSNNFPGDAQASQKALVLKNPPANAGDLRDLGSIPGSGRTSGGGHGNPLQYSCLENPMDRGAWWAIDHSVAKSWTLQKWLSTHTHTHMLMLLALEPYFESHCYKIWFLPMWLKLVCLHHAHIPTLGEEAKKKRQEAEHSHLTWE